MSILSSGEREKAGAMVNRWDEHFLQLAADCAKMSKDPSTKVGAVVIGPDREVRSTGFNGFPRGIADTHERLHDRETKLELIVHAEMNAILNAARAGTPMLGCTLYLVATDSSGSVWGGPPCVRCTVETIQAGIGCIVSRPFKSVPSRWKDSIEKARLLLDEANITYREM
ncbi:MAG: CMP deaminase [Planctomycetota bacterium]